MYLCIYKAYSTSVRMVSPHLFTDFFLDYFLRGAYTPPRNIPLYFSDFSIYLQFLKNKNSPKIKNKKLSKKF